MSKFRVGLSAAFTRQDNKPTFPSCDWSRLANSDKVELEELTPGTVLSKELIEGFDALVLLGEKVTADTFRKDNRLKLIARMGVGFDQIDVEACTKNDVALTITPAAVRRPMASSVVLMILALAHRLIDKDRLTRTGPMGWPSRLDFFGTGLVGRTLSIIGLGNIGQEVVRLIKPFDMRIIAHDPYLDQSEIKDIDVELVNLETAFREADFLSFNCPLNDETRHIGSKAGIAAMKPTAYIINTARGPVVDQKALYKALTEQRIAGAAIDVHDSHPIPSNSKLIQLENTLLTPHIGGSSFETIDRYSSMVLKDLRVFLKGKMPKNIANPEVWPSRRTP